MEGQRNQYIIAKMNLKGRIKLEKSHYLILRLKVTITKTMQYWWRDRTENSARNNTPSTDFDKRAKQVKGETMAFQ